MSVTMTLLDGEVFYLSELLRQLIDLFEDAPESDPAIERLSPAAYRDDAEAAAEFRRLTHTDLLAQRAADANAVLDTLLAATGSDPSDIDTSGDTATAESVAITLDDAEVLAWMRTLAALRLVLAVRLGIDQNDDHDHDDPDFALYDWLAYRLETLVEATDS